MEPRPRSPIEIMRSARTFLQWHALRTHYLAQRDWTTSRRRASSEAFGRPLPWWSYSCTTFLDQVVASDARILEFGAGGSTLWWLSRGNTVTALETSSEWSQNVMARAGDRSDRLELLLGDVDDQTGGPLSRVDGPFDVVVVDHSGDRVGAVTAVSERISDAGMLILDNSDRPEYSAAIDHLIASGFTRLDFHGLGPINAFAATTSIFLRSEVLRINGRPVTHVTVPN